MKKDIQIYLLPLTSVPPEEIRKLKEKYNLFDWEIAELFNAKAYNIAQFRYKNKITVGKMNEGKHTKENEHGVRKYDKFEKIALQFYKEKHFVVKEVHSFSKYDFVVNGLRVDVKGSHIQNTPHHPFRIATKRHSKELLKNRCDYIHAICFDINKLHHYFIPTSRIHCSMLSLRPHGDSKWNRYLNKIPFKKEAK